MTLNEYQQLAHRTSDNTPIDGSKLIYPLLGVSNEAGELLGKVKKIYRDRGGVMTDDDKLKLLLELGDVQWYVAEIATQLDVELETVAELNLDKLSDRAKRGVIGGNGDNR